MRKVQVGEPRKKQIMKLISLPLFLLGFAAISSASPIACNSPSISTLQDLINVGACQYGAFVFTFPGAGFSGGQQVFNSTDPSQQASDISVTIIDNANGVGFQFRGGADFMSTYNGNGGVTIDVIYQVDNVLGPINKQYASGRNFYASVDGETALNSYIYSDAAFTNQISTAGVQNSGDTNFNDPTGNGYIAGGPIGAATNYDPTDLEAVTPSTTPIFVDDELQLSPNNGPATVGATDGDSATALGFRNQFQVPEPATLFLVGSILTFASMRRRKTAKRS